VQKIGQTKAYISPPVLEDLILCKEFLTWTKNGTSIYLISLSSPSIHLRSDVCKYGLGSYNIYSGVAWRLQILPEYIGRAHINTLEFFASIISIWLGALQNSIQHFDCILAQTDSTMAARWLKKSKFPDSINPTESSIRLVRARKLASLLMTSKTYGFQETNNVADALSRDQTSSNTDLCSLLISLYPEQTPSGQKMLEIPIKIHSWVSSVLQRLPKQQAQQRTPSTNMNDQSSNGNCSSTQLVYNMTSSSITSHT
jgi:hypothetical protein